MHHSSSEPRGPRWEGLMFFHGSLLRGPVQWLRQWFTCSTNGCWKNEGRSCRHCLKISADETIDTLSWNTRHPLQVWFTPIYSGQAQSRIYPFWPFSELYTVCGRYLPSLKERSMIDGERKTDKCLREKRGWLFRRWSWGGVCVTWCCRGCRHPPHQSIV